jgi:hypothetical protein
MPRVLHITLIEGKPAGCPLDELSDPSAVRTAAEEFDRLGRDEFLSRHGFGPARRYFLELNGRRCERPLPASPMAINFPIAALSRLGLQWRRAYRPAQAAAARLHGRADRSRFPARPSRPLGLCLQPQAVGRLQLAVTFRGSEAAEQLPLGVMVLRGAA